MGGLGMLVLESDGPHHSTRFILLKLCTSEEAHVFADVHKSDRDVGRRMSEMKNHINALHSPSDQVAESDDQAMTEEDVESVGRHQQAQLRRAAKRKPVQHRYVWYPQSQGVAMIQWETKNDDEEDEDTYG